MMANLSLLLMLMATVPLLVSSLSDTSLYFKSEQDDDPFRSQLNVKLSYQPYDETWNKFKNHYDRHYQSEAEEQYRREVFVRNVKQIEQHNQDFFAGRVSFWMAVNHFADMTDEEYREYNKLYPTRDPSLSDIHTSSSSAGFLTCRTYVPSSTSNVPDSVDWRTNGYVTRVKNQKSCGSCWAFSTTGAVEGQYYRAKRILRSFSEQQLVDCSKDFGNKGCGGGNQVKAYRYINYAGGIETEEMYPYQAVNATCRFNRNLAVTTVSGCYIVKPYSESDLKVAVATQGPVAVGIDASHTSFKQYSGGVYSESACSSVKIDHAVLVVGYGQTAGGLQYWIVKNSWSTSWGAGGYVYMARNKGNMCAIASFASFPVL